MTNAEKYKLDAYAIEGLTKDFDDWYYRYERNIINTEPSSLLNEFLNADTKPTLTEDERVILRNIDNGFTKIRREHGELYSYNKFTGNEYDVPFNHLFQFIKNGEEYSIEELLGVENN